MKPVITDSPSVSANSAVLDRPAKVLLAQAMACRSTFLQDYPV
ncbi:hypothetical protein [Paenibacillus barengoltzii]|nr:hypothetical protein [Paenibacillus barengoltzii]